jgi:hypothetical protein
VSDREGIGLTNIRRVPERGGKAERVTSFKSRDVLHRLRRKNNRVRVEWSGLAARRKWLAYAKADWTRNTDIYLIAVKEKPVRSGNVLAAGIVRLHGCTGFIVSHHDALS